MHRKRGGALVIAMVVIVLIASMISLLLAVPSAALSKTANGESKARGREVADAGLREALVFMTGAGVRVASWLPQPLPGQQPTSCYVTGNNVTFTNPVAAATPSTFTPPVVAPTVGRVCQYATYPAQGPAGTTMATSFPALAFPRFEDRGASTNFVQFGDPRREHGHYAYMIVPRGNGFYQILVEARTAQRGNGTNRNREAQLYVARLEAWVYRDSPAFPVPAATAFLNPTGGSSPATIYDTYTGVQRAAITGTDATSPPKATIPGVAIQTAGVGFTAMSSSSGNKSTSNTGVTGDPPIVGGSSGNPGPSADDYQKVQDLIAAVRNSTEAPPPASPYVVKNEYSGTAIVPPDVSQGVGITYVHIPDNTVVSSNVFTINGNNDVAGIWILDIGNNVRFDVPPVYVKNGTGSFQGVFLLNQQGSFTTNDPEGFHFIDKSGANANYIQYSSGAFGQALSIIQPAFKIASYVVK